MKTLCHYPSEEVLPHIIAEAQIAGEQAGLANPQLVNKRWGNELIYINTSDYCMKRILIKSGQHTSMHFHVRKHETLTVVQGQLRLIYKDQYGTDQEALVPSGHAYVICPGFQHQLCAHGEEDLVIIEASTYDEPTDSVRVRM